MALGSLWCSWSWIPSLTGCLTSPNPTPAPTQSFWCTNTHTQVPKDASHSLSFPRASIPVGQVMSWPWAGAHAVTEGTHMHMHAEESINYERYTCHSCSHTSVPFYLLSLIFLNLFLLNHPWSLFLCLWFFASHKAWPSSQPPNEHPRVGVAQSLGTIFQHSISSGQWLLKAIGCCRSSPTYSTGSHLVPWIHYVFLRLSFHTLQSRPQF